MTPSQTSEEGRKEIAQLEAVKEWVLEHQSGFPTRFGQNLTAFLNSEIEKIKGQK